MEYQYKVRMTCEGCSGAISRVLSKVTKIINNQNSQVINFDISLESQIVRVNSDTLSKEQIYEIIKKTGKETEYI